MAWTDENVGVLKALWSEGRSAREIGDKLGMTRNAVIGKANRLGLTHKAASRSAARGRATERRLSSPLDLTERMCRWPIGHPGEADFHFCGGARAPGRPYCEAHCNLAYRNRTTEAA